MIAAKQKCPGAGCMKIVPNGERCERHRDEVRIRIFDGHKESARVRGYTAEWDGLSKRYRRDHPLCVMCLAKGVVKPSACVDHIIPVACCPELTMEIDNLQAACSRCNTIKGRSEPTETWHPNPNRIVVCGLPGTGKTTYAQQTGFTYWDSDQHYHLRKWKDVQEARTKWILHLRKDEPCVVIVASTITASKIACHLGGTVKHMSTVYVNRGRHGIWD